MSICVVKPIGTCLREARRSAGKDSIIAAAKMTNRSPETIGRHERGEVGLHPTDVLQYAQVYKSPDLLLRYCNGCPISQALNGGMATQDRDLPWSVLRLSTRLHKAAQYAETLETVAEDGEIDQRELPQFMAVVAFLEELTSATRELLLYAMSAGLLTPEGMKKDRTAGTVPARAVTASALQSR